jgi:transcriptional regulator with XRE-family HTH domain
MSVRMSERTKLAMKWTHFGISQEELARRSGLSLGTLRRLERGEMRNPPLRYLVNCAIALEVGLDEILEEEWRRWMVFSAEAAEPPEIGWHWGEIWRERHPPPQIPSDERRA